MATYKEIYQVYAPKHGLPKECGDYFDYQIGEKVKFAYFYMESGFCRIYGGDPELSSNFRSPTLIVKRCSSCGLWHTHGSLCHFFVSGEHIEYLCQIQRIERQLAISVPEKAKEFEDIALKICEIYRIRMKEEFGIE